MKGIFYKISVYRLNWVRNIHKLCRVSQMRFLGYILLQISNPRAICRKNMQRSLRLCEIGSVPPRAAERVKLRFLIRPTFVELPIRCTP